MFRIIVVLKEIVLQMMCEYYEAVYKRSYDKAEKYYSRYQRFDTRAKYAEKKLNKLNSEYQKVEGL